MPAPTTMTHSPTPGPSFDGTPPGGSHAASVSYRERRAWIGEYFDRTAADAWKALTSDAPVSRVRASVRAGRDTMRETLLSYLPPDLHGMRVLDAGCGTGTAAMALAERGAEVVAIDLSPTLVEHAQERAEAAGAPPIDFRSGDMLDPSLGTFDYVLAMDSIIHYELPEMMAVLSALAPRVRERMLITVAPRTPMLTVMRAVGGSFRAPIVHRPSCRCPTTLSGRPSRPYRPWIPGASSGLAWWNRASIARWPSSCRTRHCAAMPHRRAERSTIRKRRARWNR